MPRIDGIDVSHWNVMTDADAVPAMSLMSCKATEGKTFHSPTLATYAAVFAAKEARYQGVYHWIRTDSSVTDQINNLVKALNKVGWIEPNGELARGRLIQLDWERTFKYPKDQPPVQISDPSVAFIEQWIDGVVQRFGDRVIVYCSDWMPNFVAWRERNPTVPLWYANYNTGDSATGGRRECEKFNADVWQWSSKTKVLGFEKGIDVNEILNVDALERIAGHTGVAPPTISITGDQIDPSDIGHDEGGQDVSSHRWVPKGFKNQFEMPGCLPVTPADIMPHNIGRAPVDTADPFAALPLIVEFHPHRFWAIVHRNGITAQQIAEGYFIRDPDTDLSPEQLDFYRAQGIPI